MLTRAFAGPGLTVAGDGSRLAGRGSVSRDDVARLSQLLRTSSDDDRDDRSCMSWQGGRVGGRPAADAGILRRWAVTRGVDALPTLGTGAVRACLAGFELPAIAHSGLLARLVTRTTCKDGLDHQLGCVPERDVPAPGQHHYLRLGG